MPTFPLCRGFKSFSEYLPPFHHILSHHYCLDRMISLFECTCWLHKSIIKDTIGGLVENVLIKYSMSKNNKNKMGTHYTNRVLCPSLYVCTTTIAQKKTKAGHTLLQSRVMSIFVYMHHNYSTPTDARQPWKAVRSHQHGIADNELLLLRSERIRI